MLETETKDQKIIEEFSNRLLLECRQDLDKIIFFGSRAKGIAKPDSDYDVLLVINQKDHKLIDKIYSISTDFSLEKGIDLSLKIYTVNDFREKIESPLPFFLNIKKTGVEIWSKP